MEVSDREKVIKGLECCTDGFMMCKRERCPYYGKAPIDSTCRIELEKDALALLKEQEPIKPTVSVDTWICSKCGHTLESQELIDDKENPQVLIHEQYEYCPCCGRKVNWDA